MQDPAPYLTDLGIRVRCAVEPDRSAIVDGAHRSLVNWEVYFFSSLENKKRFDAEPEAFCGLVTDPVTMERFQPTTESPRRVYGERLFLFASPRSLETFSEYPDSLSQPRFRMRGM